MRLTEGQFFGESALKEVNIGGGGRGGPSLTALERLVVGVTLAHRRTLKFQLTGIGSLPAGSLGSGVGAKVALTN